MYEKYCGFSTKYCAHTNLIAERYVGVKKIIAVSTKVHIVWILQKNCVWTKLIVERCVHQKKFLCNTDCTLPSLTVTSFQKS
jgi:hypothetical protein